MNARTLTRLSLTLAATIAAALSVHSVQAQKVIDLPRVVVIGQRVVAQAAVNAVELPRVVVTGRKLAAPDTELVKAQADTSARG